MAVFAPLIADYPAGFGPDVLQPPSAAHWFGTDNLGRDVFAEVVWGTRISMIIAAPVLASLAIAIGVVVAVVGAYFPRIDPAVGRSWTSVLSLPVLPLMILVAALVGPSLTTIVLVIAFFSWPEVARVVRSQALSVVRAALHGRGAGHRRRHQLDHPPAPAARGGSGHRRAVVLTASRAVLSEAGLAFLGLGDPNSWSWGRILYEAQQSGAMSSAWWTTLFPSARDPRAGARRHPPRHRLQRRPQPARAHEGLTDMGFASG